MSNNDEHPRRYVYIDLCVCNRDGSPIEDKDIGSILEDATMTLNLKNFSVAGVALRTSTDDEILELRGKVDEKNEEVLRLKAKVNHLLKLVEE